MADSDSQLSKTPESFANLQSFKDAISGKSGYNIEVVNDTKMLVGYSPAKILSNTWTVLLMEPYSQVNKYELIPSDHIFVLPCVD